MDEPQRPGADEGYRLLFEKNPHAMWVYDLETLRFLEVNQVAVHRYGYSREEFLRMTIKDIRPPEDVPRLMETIRAVRRDIEQSGVWRHRKRDGTVIHVDITSHTLDYAGRRAVLVLAQDVSEQVRAEKAMRESEERFRALTEGSAAAICLYNESGFLFVNRASEVLTGYSREEMLGKAPWDLARPDFREVIRSRMLARLRGEAVPVRYEVAMITKGGEERWLDLSLTTIEYQGRPAALGTAFDVTDRKRTEEQSRLQSVALAAAANAIIITNLDGTIQWVNPAFTTLTGYTFVEAVGQNPRLLHSGQHTKEFYEALWKTILSGRVWHGEVVNKRKDGQLYTEEMTVTPVRDSDGKVTNFIAIKQDVTDRRRTERALRESEGKFRALAESAAAAIFISQGDRMVYANAATARILGMDPAALVGQEFWSFIHPDSRDSVRELREARLRGANVPSRYEMKILTADKKDRWIDFTATLVEWEGKPAVLGTAFDVTERKRLEEQFRQAQKMEAVGRLAGGIAHDFNNLLGVILGYSELVLETPAVSDPGLRRRIEEIHKAAGRAAALTRQLLAFSRQQVLEPRVLRVNGVVEDIEKMLRRLIGEDIELVTRLDAGVGLVKADPGQLEQVVMNLAVNARDAMPRGGRLLIETRNVEVDATVARQLATFERGRYVLLSVSDTGVGMDEEVRSHLFEPFYTTKEKGKGTGLGLATVYGIVKQSGGYIWVYSEPGRGSTFKIYLPRVDEEEPEIRAAPAELETLQGSETVLVVEDEASLRALMTEFLGQSGYMVLEAGDATAALALAGDHQDIRLLLTDVVLPGRSGRELAEELQKALPNLKVVYVSGYTDDAILRHGIDDPGVAFLQKPFSRDALLRKVRATLDDTTS